MRARFFMVCVATLASALPGVAQSSRDKVAIRTVRVGYPPGPHSQTPDEISTMQRPPMFKSGGWTPIFVDVQNTGRYDPGSDGPAIVSVDTVDCDDMTTTYSAPLPPFDDGGSTSVILYTRPGGRYSDISIRVQARGRDLCSPDSRSYAGLDANQLLYLAIGSKLPGLKLPGGGAERQPGAMSMASKAEVALITRLLDMPTQWFGYGSTDLVILASSDRDFVVSLLNDQAGRKAALAEWVRRGGRIIVCAGKNRDQFAGSPELQALLPMTIGGPYVVPEASLRWRTRLLEGGGEEGTTTLAGADSKPLEFTHLEPRDGRPTRVLVDGPAGPEGKPASPLVVQGPYGLGRVTLVAFDIDLKPFRGWNGEGAFWDQLLIQSGPPPAAGATSSRSPFINMNESSDEALSNVVNRLEQFEGVPVISFGWVALFILLYILVVGPLDYLFLKKVVKRLELTWITFPTVVLAVSAAAYFTAYHLKGSDLRINRIDLVDYDFETKQAYGRAFFSIFSPRIQKYTIGVEPAQEWAAPAGDASASGTVVSWFGNPKAAREGFFRHSYDYARLADGLLNVPINVWSTKGFQAEWAAPIDKDKPPLTVSLQRTGTDDLIGTVTNQLPVDLEETVLIYRGTVANLGTLLSGTPKTVSAAKRRQFGQWLQNAEAEEPEIGGLRPAESGRLAGGNAIAARLNIDLLFHEANRLNRAASNGSLRDIDQSWRLNDSERDEAILVAHLPLPETPGDSEATNASPANPTRLWLGKLPTDRKPNGEPEARPPLQGTMRQEVYVRVFIPVIGAAKRP